MYICMYFRNTPTDFKCAQCCVTRIQWRLNMIIRETWRIQNHDRTIPLEWCRPSAVSSFCSYRFLAQILLTPLAISRFLKGSSRYASIKINGHCTLQLFICAEIKSSSCKKYDKPYCSRYMVFLLLWFHLEFHGRIKQHIYVA